MDNTIRSVLRQVVVLFSKNGWTDREDAALTLSRIITDDRLTLRTMSEVSSMFFAHNRVSRIRVLDTLKSVKAVGASGVNSTIKILFLSASPKIVGEKDERIRVDKEARNIIKKLRSSSNRDRLTLVELPATKPEDVIDELNRLNPSILHISSHGNAGGLLLEEGERNNGFLTSSQLSGIVSTIPSLKIVVLNSCHSSNQAKSLTEHVDIAIGMSQGIGDLSAAIFSEQFYSSLAESVTAKVAFDQARLAISLAGLEDNDVPEIHAAKGVKLKNYFILQ
jgi:hypothetical protein